MTPPTPTAILATALIKDIESVEHTSGTSVHSTARSEANLKNMTEPTGHELPEATQHNTNQNNYLKRTKKKINTQQDDKMEQKKGKNKK